MENENVVPRVDTDNTPESMDEWFELEGEEIKERSSALRANSGLDREHVCLSVFNTLTKKASICGIKGFGRVRLCVGRCMHLTVICFGCDLYSIWARDG